MYGKQLRSCRDSQLLNHSSWAKFTILSPVTDLFFLNQQKMEFLPTKECAGCETAAYEADQGWYWRYNIMKVENNNGVGETCK